MSTQRHITNQLRLRRTGRGSGEPSAIVVPVREGRGPIGGPYSESRRGAGAVGGALQPATAADAEELKGTRFAPLGGRAAQQHRET